MVSSDPNNAFPFLDYVPDDIVGKGMGIARIEFPCPETVSVIHVKAVPCPDPEHLLRILEQAGHGTIGQALGRPEIHLLDIRPTNRRKEDE